MADALTTRGLAVTQIEQLPEVLPTVTRWAEVVLVVVGVRPDASLPA
jgi:hypothetical protein